MSARMHEELLSSDLPANEGTRRPFKGDAGPEKPADSLLSLPQARLQKNGRQKGRSKGLAAPGRLTTERH